MIVRIQLANGAEEKARMCFGSHAGGRRHSESHESRRQQEHDDKSGIAIPVFNMAYLRSCRRYDLKSAPSWKQVVRSAKAFKIINSVASVEGETPEIALIENPVESMLSN